MKKKTNDSQGEKIAKVEPVGEVVSSADSPSVSLTNLEMLKYCFICKSTDNLTQHHMKNIHSAKHKKRDKHRGIIVLCRNCHDIVEDIVNKGKSKKAWYEKGWNDRNKAILKDLKEHRKKLDYLWQQGDIGTITYKTRELVDWLDGYEELIKKGVK